MKAFCRGLLWCAPLLAVVCSAAERRLVTVDDIIAIREVAAPELSPDGEWVALRVVCCYIQFSAMIPADEHAYI